ncbi:hypothetical protein AAH975_14015, partial [Enterococcus faecalis]|uniref:hypothetical protein n=1 Tax=Enterococcus faecalis TaxID=1351 RepID=UPI0031CD5300
WRLRNARACFAQTVKVHSPPAKPNGRWVTLGVFVIFLSLPAAIAKVHLKRAAIGYKDRNAVAIDGLHCCKFCRPFGTLLQLP